MQALELHQRLEQQTPEHTSVASMLARFEPVTPVFATMTQHEEVTGSDKTLDG